MWRATGSIAAGPSQPEPADAAGAVRLRARSRVGQGHLPRLPGTVRMAPERARRARDRSRPTCPVVFTDRRPGLPITDSVRRSTWWAHHPGASPGGRVALARRGRADPAGQARYGVHRLARGRLASGVSTTLTNSGVPFPFRDTTARNNLRYFYSVTAFDVNSVNRARPASSRRATPRRSRRRHAEQLQTTRPPRRRSSPVGGSRMTVGRPSDHRRDHRQVQRALPPGQRCDRSASGRVCQAVIHCRPARCR